VSGRIGDVVDEPAVLAVIDVHNGSKEVIGPIHARLVYEDKSWPESPGLALQAVHPETSVRIHLMGRNELPLGVPILSPSITFRDSTGRWWERKGTEPIRAAGAKPRLDVLHRSAMPDGFAAIALGTGYRQTHISSTTVLRWFDLAARVPLLQHIVDRFELREKAEQRARKKFWREMQATDIVGEIDEHG